MSRAAPRTNTVGDVVSIPQCKSRRQGRSSPHRRAASHTIWCIRPLEPGGRPPGGRELVSSGPLLSWDAETFLANGLIEAGVGVAYTYGPLHIDGFAHLGLARVRRSNKSVSGELFGDRGTVTRGAPTARDEGVSGCRTHGSIHACSSGAC
jgi:hypothetical protein